MLQFPSLYTLMIRWNFAYILHSDSSASRTIQQHRPFYFHQPSTLPLPPPSNFRQIYQPSQGSPWILVWPKILLLVFEILVWKPISIFQYLKSWAEMYTNINNIQYLEQKFFKLKNNTNIPIFWFPFLTFYEPISINQYF